MNPRIRELYNTVAGSDKLGFDSYLAEKFAELIVRECCQKLESDGMVEVAMELKEHFGVE